MDKLRDWRAAAGLKKGEDQIGHDLGWEAGLRIPQGTLGCGPGFREKQRELRIPGETPGKLQRKEGMSCQTKGRTEDQRRDGKRRDREEVEFRFSLANIYCVFTGPGLMLSPGGTDNKT